MESWVAVGDVCITYLIPLCLMPFHYVETPFFSLVQSASSSIETMLPNGGNLNLN